MRPLYTTVLQSSMDLQYESILDDQDVLVGNATKRVEDMNKWYKAWEKFDKEFWEEFLKLAENEGRMTPDDLVIQTSGEKHGYTTKSKYIIKHISGYCARSYQFAVQKAFVNLVKKLYMKHFSKQADLSGTPDRIELKIDNPFEGQDKLEKLTAGFIDLDASYIFVQMKKYVK